jgi:dTDP-4-amino-4,6-dideoxyglucose formyltransferase
MRTLILTDNRISIELAFELQRRHPEISICQSPPGIFDQVPCIDVKRDIASILEQYSLVISLHCKQIFPGELVAKCRCINVHPGYNPDNRGWFPHVFSIVNGLKAGITIHLMDDQLDHGPIIIQKECAISSYDTSESLYEKLMVLERELVLEWYPRIRDGLYTAYSPAEEGNINYKKDYESLKQFDLDQRGTFREFIDRLRALSHGSYKNAYYLDEDDKRVFMRLVLEREDGES